MFLKEQEERRKKLLKFPKKLPVKLLNNDRE